MKIITLIALILTGFTESAQVDSLTVTTTFTTRPCDIDTVKGILIWNDPNKDWNDGNVYDTGYWVGKCGPLGLPIPDMTFIPGTFKRTYQYADMVGKKQGPWKTARSTTQHGQFFTRRWKKINSNDVYCLYVLYQKPLKGF